MSSPAPVVVSRSELERFAAGLLRAGGASAEDARLVAESLLDANLKGHESHGVIRIPDYVEQLRLGELVSGVDIAVMSETPAILAGDAGYGFGQVQCRKLIDRLEPKARALGVACGTLKRCGHVGRLGEWVERAAERGLAGFITVNDNGVLKCVAPPGGIGAKISTNPMGLAVPTDGDPLMLDISTSAVANGKVKVALMSGKQCPPGWLLDAEGNPTTDPATRFSKPEGTLLPFGGEQSYKGFGLGLLLDCLAGGLTGGYCPPAPEGVPVTNNVVMVLWDPTLFAGKEHFVTEASKVIESVRSTPRRPGVDSIRLPGDRGHNLHDERTRNGVPIDGGTWKALGTLAEKLNVSVPPTKS